MPTMEEVRTMEAIQCINQKIPELSLRDMFAMNIVSGMVSWEDWRDYEPKDFATQAYQIADAMLEARKKKN